MSNAQGMVVTLEGKLIRQPGYSEDMLEYINSGKRLEVLNKHIK